MRKWRKHKKPEKNLTVAIAVTSVWKHKNGMNVVIEDDDEELYDDGNDIMFNRMITDISTNDINMDHGFVKEDETSDSEEINIGKHKKTNGMDDDDDNTKMREPKEIVESEDNEFVNVKGSSNSDDDIVITNSTTSAGL